jgi:hypothetical protein
MNGGCIYLAAWCIVEASQGTPTEGKTMNKNLTLGGAVHAQYRPGADHKILLCGGSNKASERYSWTREDVTCKRCLKAQAAQAEAAERTAYYAGLAEGQDAVGSQAAVIEFAEAPAAAPTGLTQAEAVAMFEVTETQGEPVAMIADGAQVEIVTDTVIERFAYSQTTLKAGTRGTVIDGKVTRRGQVEYLVRIDGTDRAEWLYASEVREDDGLTPAQRGALLIKCVVCQAAPGAPCIYTSGTRSRRATPHRTRVLTTELRAERAEAEQQAAERAAAKRPVVVYLSINYDDTATVWVTGGHGFAEQPQLYIATRHQGGAWYGEDEDRGLKASGGTPVGCTRNWLRQLFKVDTARDFDVRVKDDRR